MRVLWALAILILAGCGGDRIASESGDHNALVVIIAQEPDGDVTYTSGTRFEPTFTEQKSSTTMSVLMGVNEFRASNPIAHAIVGAGLAASHSDDVGIEAEVELIVGGATRIVELVASANGEVVGEVTEIGDVSIFVELRWVADDAYDQSGQSITVTTPTSGSSIEIGQTGPASNPISNVLGTGRSVDEGEIDLRNIDVIDGQANVYVFCENGHANQIGENVPIGNEVSIGPLISRVPVDDGILDVEATSCDPPTR